MIRYVDAESVLRSVADACPGVLNISVRPEHDLGSFVIDSKWQPPKTPVGVELADEVAELDVPGEDEEVPWLTPISAEDVIEALEGAKEVVFLLHLLKVTTATALEHAYAGMDYTRVGGLARLAQEAIVALRLRWPHGFEEAEHRHE